MNGKNKENKLLEQLIKNLPSRPEEVKVAKKLSVKDAIVGLREQVGTKVFTKRLLLELIEAAYPELVPVAMSNLGVSIERATDYLEVVKQGEQNVYRYKKIK